jgi:3-isopropylmalate dehydratase small subunit
MYVSSSETGSFSKRESDQSLIVLANENFGLGSVEPHAPLLNAPRGNQLLY